MQQIGSSTMSYANQVFLRKRHDEIDAVLRSVGLSLHTEVALLDFPRHQNAGDTLIYTGEITALERLGVTPKYIADIGRYSAPLLRRSLSARGLILMHGGGNFGDIWPTFQDERERVVSENPQNAIVMLPQTVYFNNEKRAAQTNAIFAKHGRVILLVRDYDSLERARKLLPDVESRFCHDSALSNDPFPALSSPIHRWIVIDRKDREAAGSLVRATDFDGTVADWGLTGRDRFEWGLRRTPLAVHKRLPARLRAVPSAYRIVAHQYPRMAEINMRSARRILETGETVLTNRLHAHVLGILMGKRSMVIENNYGKIGPIVSASLQGFEDAEMLRKADVETVLADL